jgi:hypothetical protein
MKIGVSEWQSNGMMGLKPLLQYSTTPSLHSPEVLYG